MFTEGWILSQRNFNTLQRTNLFNGQEANFSSILKQAIIKVHCNQFMSYTSVCLCKTELTLHKCKDLNPHLSESSHKFVIAMATNKKQGSHE